MVSSMMRRPRNSVQEVHVAVLGLNGSGKSALTVKYITRRYITEYDPSIEDTYCKHEFIRGHEYMVWIMDTVSGEGKECSRYLGWADVFLVVYSITSLQSFEYARKVLEEISSHDHSFCIRQHITLLIGNKTDLERYRQVSKAQGSGLATEFGAEFFELNTTEEYSLVKTVFQHGITAVVSERLNLLTQRSPSPAGGAGNGLGGRNKGIFQRGDRGTATETSDSDVPSSPNGGGASGSMTPKESSTPSPKRSATVSVGWRSKSPSAKLQDSIKSNSTTLPPRLPTVLEKTPHVGSIPANNSTPSNLSNTSTAAAQNPPKKPSSGLKLFKLFNT